VNEISPEGTNVEPTLDTAYRIGCGAVAKLLMPGKDPGGIWITMILGIAGSIIATYLGQAIGWYQAGQTAGFIMSVVGAMLLLILYRIIRGAMAKAG